MILPIFVQVLGILIYQGPSLNLIQTARDFASALILFSLFLGLIVLIPMSIAQILSVIVLIRSRCSDLKLLLIGLLNPSLALVCILIVGWPW